VSQFTITLGCNYPLGTAGKDESVVEFGPALAVSSRELMPVHQFLNTAFVAEKKLSNYELHNNLLFFTLQASHCFKIKINHSLSTINAYCLPWFNTTAATVSSNLLNLRSSTSHVTAQRGLVSAFYGALTNSHGDHVSSGANFNNNNASANVRSDKQREA